MFVLNYKIDIIDDQKHNDKVPVASLNHSKEAGTNELEINTLKDTFDEENDLKIGLKVP